MPEVYETHNKRITLIDLSDCLDLLPKSFGFTVSAFPVNIRAASAGWSRVVAIFEESLA